MFLQDKIIWVTGASRGIGKETAKILASRGAKIVVSSRNKSSLEELVEEVISTGGQKPFVLEYDITDLPSAKNAFVQVQKEFKRLDGLVNNAGILEDALLGMISVENVNRTFQTNTYSVIFHMQYASRLMTKNKSGSIVNVSSIIGRVGNEGQVVYGGSKAAVIGITQSAAKELAPNNIRVNAVAPGFINTDMVKQLSKDKYDQRLNSIKMQRIGNPEEVGNVIAFLLSDLSSYVTGQVIGVDGGMLV